MREGFIKRFIEKEQYQQNSLLTIDEFLNYCKKRGINTNEKELEFFEKEGLLYPLIRIDRPIGEKEWISFVKEDGQNFSRSAEYGLNEGEKEISRHKQRYYSSYGFNSNCKTILIEWIKAGVLFDPSTRIFQDWSLFRSEKLMWDDKKIISLYVSYQIYWLDVLKKNYSFNINLSSGKLIVSSPYIDGNSISTSSGSYELNNFEEFSDKFGVICEDEFLNKFFNLEIKKLDLKKDLYEFNCILEFLIGIQNIYAPYGRSGLNTIQIIHDAFDSDTWEEKRRHFDPKEELRLLSVDIETVFHYYQMFSKKSIDLLGNGRANDWIQLWINIRWYKKDLLDGSIRLGVEYLQWALMLKRFIEDYLGNETLDVDEIIKTDINFAIKCDPYKIPQGWNLRGSRNDRLSDDNKNYYADIYKRLFYLINDFGLNYQPCVMVFVEGATEETIIPKFFEKYYGKPESLGIEFINFKGVDKLLSTSKTSEELKALINGIQEDIRQKVISTSHRKKLNELIKKLSDIDIIISNWTSFISYNLENWQILPFFVSDNEGNIKHFLEAESPIKYNLTNYNIPNDWRFLWGVDNENKPFKGSNFEFANYTNEELALAISEVLGEKIDQDFVGFVRDNEGTVKKINDKIDVEAKIKINDKLCENLLKKYDAKIDRTITQRPIFKLIEKISLMAELNHLPVDRKVEVENRRRIEEILLGTRHL